MQFDSYSTHLFQCKPCRDSWAIAKKRFPQFDWEVARCAEKETGPILWGTKGLARMEWQYNTFYLEVDGKVFMDWTAWDTDSVDLKLYVAAALWSDTDDDARRVGWLD